MDLITLILQIVLTIPLTIILNYFNKKENNVLNGIIIPTAYMLIIAALIPRVKINVFLIVIFEIFIRNFYVTSIVMEENKKTNSSFLIESLISIALSLFTYNFFIARVDTVIPDPEDIKSFLWFLIIIYGAYLYKISTKDKVQEKTAKTKKHNKEQNIMQYAKFKNQYGLLIKSKNQNINNLVYAIMIYENYKTPKLYRNIKSYIGSITRRETPYGIMQVKSWNRMSDEESITFTIKEFESKLKGTSLKEKEQLDKLLNDYNKETKDNIKTIYDEIIEFQKK